MKHVRYALFDDVTAARATVHDIETAGVARERLSFSVHKDRLHEDNLGPSESDGRHGLLVGLLCGAIVGAVFGLLLAGPLGVVHLPRVQAALSGAFAGMIFGTLGPALYSAGIPNRSLSRLARMLRPGRVLITIEAEGQDAIGVVDEILKKHHAVISAS